VSTRKKKKKSGSHQCIVLRGQQKMSEKAHPESGGGNLTLVCWYLESKTGHLEENRVAPGTLRAPAQSQIGVTKRMKGQPKCPGTQRDQITRKPSKMGRLRHVQQKSGANIISRTSSGRKGEPPSLQNHEGNVNDEKAGGTEKLEDRIRNPRFAIEGRRPRRSRLEAKEAQTYKTRGRGKSGQRSLN